ncbi:MAG TPA: thiol:disulfide interchange protein DsbA/DsbL [Burkholderiales bacterium]|nr:thiol:disulfide interchange protein DsbA/DsbL [Burkholderiales bacterium]
MNLITSFLRHAVFMLALAISSAASAQISPGKDYRLINPPQPTESGKRIEVLEFFWYACPHCNALQPPLRAWLKQKPADVDFRRVPAVFDDSWLPLTYAYHAFDAMGVVDRIHYDVFAAIHEQKLRLSDQAVLFDWVAKHGIDRQKFADTYNSFGVKNRGARSIEQTRNYDIPGTPAIIVDGKYLTAPSMILKPDRTVDYERYFRALDQVIAMARKERATRK